MLTGPIAPVEAQVLRLTELFGLSFHTVHTRAVLLNWFSCRAAGGNNEGRANVFNGESRLALPRRLEIRHRLHQRLSIAAIMRVLRHAHSDR